MIKDYQQACAVLGVSTDADRETIKSAYRSISKQLHPDAHPQQNETIREAYFLVTEAYEYLEHHETPTAAPATSRVMGSPLGRYTATPEMRQNKERFDRKYRVRAAQSKAKQQEELRERQEQMAKKRREKEILNEIRMIRLAHAIQAAMHASAMEDIEK
ncbi:MAG: DnaJ domain-containing protein [Lachnospiraceae bacterium]|nr:DnaJ domain-containing protein [Lachnospiraceae bacterium]